jgi:hypothetical protein
MNPKLGIVCIPVEGCSHNLLNPKTLQNDKGNTTNFFRTTARNHMILGKFGMPSL